MQSVKINTTAEREKTCPQCAAVFACQTNDCWCSKLPPIMPMDGTGGCYCPECLKTIIDSKLAGS